VRGQLEGARAQRRTQSRKDVIHSRVVGAVTIPKLIHEPAQHTLYRGAMMWFHQPKSPAR
jgi:hypothetical protein